MENNNELVVTTPNIEGFEYKRVNFNEPISVTTYGLDILLKMQELSDVHAQMIKAQGETSNLDNEIDSIVRYGDQIRSGEKNESKGLMKLARKGIRRVRNLTKKEDVPFDENYVKYEQYQENLRKIADNVEQDKNNAIKEGEINNKFLKDMDPLVKQLELAIKIGYSDLDAYENGTLVELELAYQNDPSDNNKRSFARGKQAVKLFKDKLVELQNSLTQYNQTLFEIEISLGTSMELISSYNDYLTSTSPNLSVRGNSMLVNQRNREKIDKHRALIESINEFYIATAEASVENIKDAVALNENGNITIDTIKKVDEIMSKGVALLTESINKRDEMRQETIASLEQISKNFDSYREQVGNILYEEMQVLDTGSSTHYLSSAPKTRKQVRGKKR